MRDEHPTDAALDDYIDDIADTDARDALEAHLRSCDACSVRLARAAEAELVLLELAAAPRRPASAIRRPIIVASAVAVAAAVLAIVLRDRPPSPVPRELAESPPATTSEPYESSDVALATPEDQLELPASAELAVQFVPEAEP